MNDAMRVSVGQRVEQVTPDSRCIRHRQCAFAPQPGAQ
jgi:hypothetical protein